LIPILLCVLALQADAPPGSRSGSRPIVVPKMWDEDELETWATTARRLGVPPSFISEEEYYAAPIDNLRTYPSTIRRANRRAIASRCGELGPQPLIAPEQLKTEADWIEAGRRVFEELDTPASRSDDPAVLAHFTSAKAIDEYRDAQHDTMSADGVLLDYRWVVDRDGKLKLSLASCQGCHTRVMPDGTTLPGAPSNFDLSAAPAVQSLLKPLRLSPTASRGEEFYAQFGVPWRKDDVHQPFKAMTNAEFAKFASLDDGAPPGTMFARVNGSLFFATRMADLRGIRDRAYLDTTATHLNRGPADLARYCILVEFADAAVFGSHQMLPEPVKVRLRPPDEAMYALALYLDSLDPPRSPNPLDDVARHGQQIFETQGCAKCHTPPVYTNNKLVPVPGFDPPRDDPRTALLAIADRRVDTDPGLALETRKGTGYYKVPSLRGLWYRGLYGHSGFVASLEDWFDPARLRTDYVPTGWRGPGVKTRAILGHEFGLDLKPDDKRALIAFLLTL
jgi:mono/diheme cytochrome c family protein